MLETLRIVIALAVMALFAGIVWWAYAPSRKEEWEERGKMLEEVDE